MARFITFIAACAAFAVAIVPPVSLYLASQALLRGKIEVQAQTYAYQVEREARLNPEFWNALAGTAAEGGLNGLEVSRPPNIVATEDAEARRVFSGAGQTLIDVAAPAEPRWPLSVAHAPVTDGLTEIGRVEIARSLRPALRDGAAAASLSGGFGVLIFLLVRVVPLRMLHAAIEHASFVSAHDQLTGLPNRRLFRDRLEQALIAVYRDAEQLCVLYLDLDHFKNINDLLGHPAGDATLRIVADRLRTCLRASDTLARLGGDEFAIILPAVRRPDDADRLAREVLELIAQPLDLEGQIRSVGLSIGVSVARPGARTTPELLMKQADMALYRAKAEGRGRSCFYTPDMDSALRERHAMETDLRVAIAEQTLTVHYQPQIELESGRIKGAEALLRWNRPGHGMVNPDRFIPLAEDSGLIAPIGLWVLREACRRASTWPADMRIAVNVSPIQFRSAGFCQSVIDTILETGIDPRRVELEITEGILLRNTNETMSVLQRLREFGTRLAMDDFGTGYSSLSYLSKFRFDKIKIDRGFTSRMDRDPGAMAIVRAVVGMTLALGVTTNAEGVENATQARMLRALGCTEAQGYLFGRPMPGEMFEALIISGQYDADLSPGERDRALA